MHPGRVHYGSFPLPAPTTMPPRRFLTSAGGAALALACGCSSGLKEFPTAPVTGTVTCEGTPLKSGRIQFAPAAVPGELEAGKPALGVIGPDGRFTLQTYGNADGAVVGTHRVSVWPDEPQGPDPRAETREERGSADESLGGCEGGLLERVYEVTPGGNEFAVELSGG